MNIFLWDKGEMFFRGGTNNLKDSFKNDSKNQLLHLKKRSYRFSSTSKNKVNGWMGLNSSEIVYCFFTQTNELNFLNCSQGALSICSKFPWLLLECQMVRAIPIRASGKCSFFLVDTPTISRFFWSEKVLPFYDWKLCSTTLWTLSTGWKMSTKWKAPVLSVITELSCIHTNVDKSGRHNTKISKFIWVVTLW